jgi:hypothetical protein
MLDDRPSPFRSGTGFLASSGRRQPRRGRRASRTLDPVPERASGRDVSPSSRYRNGALQERHRPLAADRRVSDRTRTGDHLDHNQELYLLSYAHRVRPM